MIDQFILTWITHFAYLAIFLALIASTIAVPIPEEIVLLIAGYLASQQVLNFWIVLGVSLLAIIIGDNIGYQLGKHGGGFLLERFMHTRIQKWVQTHFTKHGPKTVFLSRFMTGIRNIFHITAGASGMSWTTFFFYDLLGALIATPIVLAIGYFFGAHLSIFARIIKTIDTTLLIGFLIVLLILALLACFFREQTKNLILTKLLHKRIKNRLEKSWYYKIK